MLVAKHFPVFWLTSRQFRSGRGTLVVILFAAVSVILAAIYLLGSRWTSGPNFLARTYFDMLAPTVVPLATLILATSAFGNEIGDRTLSYLVLKPVGRARIVLEKFLGVVLVTSLTFLVGLGITWGMVALADVTVGGTLLWSLLLGTLVGILAYGALFLLVSLLTQRALLIGIVYILLWESLLARFIPGVKIVSVRHFAQSIFVQTLGSSPVSLPDAISLNGSLITVACVVVLSLALATLRLRQMDLE